MTELSIIMPTWNCMENKRNSLELVLFSIERQHISKECIEIVFVDNGSTDNTLSFLKKWIDSNRPRYGNLQLCMNPGELNRSKTRNIGVHAATGRKLLFMDDDTILTDEDTLKVLLNEFYAKNSFFCGASRYWTLVEWEYNLIRQLILNHSPIDEWAFLPKGISRLTGNRDLQEFTFIGNFGGLMKDDFLKAGGFDAERFPARQEDVELMYRLLLKQFSFKLLFEKVKVVHLTHPMTGDRSGERQHWFKEFRKKEQEEGYYFCINHLFGVIEDYGNYQPVLKKIQH